LKTLFCNIARVLSYAGILAYFENKYTLALADKFLIGGVLLVWMITYLVEDHTE